ncbi:MAG: GNAT family N-acetyltransferase [Ilumatobacteraceae bacterium]
MIDPSTIIATPRLVLQPITVADAVEMVEVLADPVLYEFTGGEPPTLAELEQRYTRQVEGSGRDGEIWCNWIVRRAVDRRAVGFVQATVVADAADLAWLIGVAYQGHNFASEAAQAMSDWLVAHGVDRSRLSAHIHPDHRASQIIAGRVGLHATGRVDDDGEAIWTSASVT